MPLRRGGWIIMAQILDIPDTSPSRELCYDAEWLAIHKCTFAPSPCRPHPPRATHVLESRRRSHLPLPASISTCAGP